MDTITHSVVGALIAHATGSQKNVEDSLPIGTRLLCGATVAAFPDIDYITVLINPLAFISYWHRGITHSFVMLPLWSLLLGITMALILRRHSQWRSFIVLSVTVLISHILLDMTTSWGTQIFSPISEYRVGLQYAFVIDPVITAIVSLALFIAMYFRAHSIAIIGIGVVTFYIVALAVLHQQAEELAKDYAQTQSLKNVQVHVLPQPLSPFNWKLVISDKEGHWHALVNLVKRKSDATLFNYKANIFEIRNLYRSKKQLRWKYFPRFADDHYSRIVWEQPDFALFRKFALLPAFYRVDNSAKEICIWYMDLRFYIPTMNTPFIYGMCKSHTSPVWVLYRIKLYSDSERQIVNAPKTMFNKSMN